MGMATSQSAMGSRAATVRVTREALLCKKKPWLLAVYNYLFLYNNNNYYYFKKFMPTGSLSKNQVAIGRFLATKKNTGW